MYFPVFRRSEGRRQAGRCLWRALACLSGLALGFAGTDAAAQAASTSGSVTVIDPLPGASGTARVVGNSDLIANFSANRTNYAAGYAISGDGTTVVGASNTSAGVARAFLWSGSSGTRDLGSLNSSSNASFAAAVSFNGQVVVGHSEVAPGRWQAFRWTASGGMENLGTFAGGNAGFSTALDVSDDGEVVVGGAYTDTTVDRAFRWTRATGMVNLGVLSGGSFSDALGVSGDGSVVVGVSAIAGGEWRAFRWTQGTGMVNMGTLGGFSGNSAATSANTDGSVIVGMSVMNAGGNTHAFRWTAATGMIDLGTIGGIAGNSIAHGVSGNGAIVVGSSQFAANSPNRAFVWTQAAGMQDLGALLSASGVDMSGIELTSARGISRAGDLITGAGTFTAASGGTRAYVARLPTAAGGVGGLTTADAVARSIQALAQSRTAQMITQMLVTSVHLGVNDQLSCQPRCGGAYASFGSFNASFHGRYNLTPEWTVLGGIGIGYSDEPGVEVRETFSLAASIRFDPDDRGPSRPFFEAGFGISPNQDVVYTRNYANGSGLATGTGATRADFGQAFVRAGWVSRLSPVSEIGGSVTLGYTEQRSRAYSEVAAAGNPFEASFNTATDRATTVSVSGQYTRLFGRRLEANVNVTVQQMLDQSTDLTGTVRGFGSVEAESRTTTWVQPGARIGWRLNANWVVDVFVNATMGERGIGTSFHGGFGITGRF